MKLRTVAAAALVLAGVCAGGGWWAWSRQQAAVFTWRTAPLVRQDVERIVSSTGTLTADPAIDVGTQVSGIVADLPVDFNDRVEKGAVLARIDPTLLEADVASAEAKLAEAEAQREKLGVELARVRSLHAKQAATDQELEAAKAASAVAEAQARTARVGLDRARRNLGYATITAPVAGTIVKRNVQKGQTVNAGFSAPVLFTMASDLTHMIILANVDESDVGLVHKDQVARFTVQTFPERTFTGTVRQVRLDAKTDQGVVTYTTVINVDNADGALFPGMTATVEFVVAQASGVLCASNGALRFSPDEGMPVVGELPAEPESASAGSSTGGGHKKGAPATTGTVWVVEGESIRGVPVNLGLRGAECTEVTGAGLAEKAEVVLGVDHPEAEKGGSPFERKGGDPRRPGGF